MGGCETKNVTIVDNGFYIGVVGQCADDWFEANTWCIDNYNTTLASIHGVQDELDVIEALDLAGWQISFGQKIVPIGLNDLTEEGVWTWNDGTPVDYENWGPMFPLEGVDCSILRGAFNATTEIITYTWQSITCEAGYKAFACNHPDKGRLYISKGFLQR